MFNKSVLGVGCMSFALKIRMIALERDITIKELAGRLRISNNNLCNKLKRNNFKESKLIQIAEALNCVYEGFLLFEIPVKRYKISGTRSWIAAPLFFLCRFTAGIAPEQASL